MIVSLMASMQSDSHFVPKRIWLVDTSLSMKTKDISSENGNISRIEAAKKLILSDIFE